MNFVYVIFSFMSFFDVIFNKLKIVKEIFLIDFSKKF